MSLIEPTSVVRFSPCLLGLAIGCCFTLPPENPDTNGVRFRSEQRPAGRKRRALACSMGWEASACKTLGMPALQQTHKHQKV